MSSKRATVGVAEHGNSAELVTLAGVDGALLDRRRIDLTRDLPTHPYQTHFRPGAPGDARLGGPGVPAI